MIFNRFINSTLVAILITGTVAMVSINNLSIFLNLKHGFYLAFIIFIIMGLIIDIFSTPTTRKILILAYTAAAIAVGVIIDVIMDILFGRFERNLFPLEIAMWYVFAPVPIIIGIIVMRIFKRQKRK